MTKEQGVIAGILIKASIRQLAFNAKRRIAKIFKISIEKEGLTNLTDFITPNEKIFMLGSLIERDFENAFDNLISEMFAVCIEKEGEGV